MEGNPHGICATFYDQYDKFSLCHFNKHAVCIRYFCKMSILNIIIDNETF